ncbi:MAG: hypothetical protein WCH34_04155 [Bacteroidota bacterium]
MTKLRRKVYMVAGYNTISMGTGRKEFHPKKDRPGLEEYMKEAGQGVLKMIGGAKNVDESVVGNFIAARSIVRQIWLALCPLLMKVCVINRQFVWKVLAEQVLWH